MTKVSDLHKQWMEDPEYRKEYERLGPEMDRAQLSYERRMEVAERISELLGKWTNERTKRGMSKRRDKRRALKRKRR